ncbi:ash family protein [Dickeya dianthicola]|nr:ash family protein [Dickeya dianthicola]MBT1458539.1 ash family protein [Dickeya dianthicola]MBT1487679.1 ash family protein [Dickeya dianthicola]
MTGVFVCTVYERRKSLAVNSSPRYLLPVPAKSGAGIGLPNTILATYDAPCVFFYVVCLAIPNYGGLSGGTARCAGSSMAGKTNSVQSTTRKIGLFGGGLNITYWRLPLWLQPSPRLTRYLPFLSALPRISSYWPVTAKTLPKF